RWLRARHGRPRLGVSREAHPEIDPLHERPRGVCQPRTRRRHRRLLLERRLQREPRVAQEAPGPRVSKARTLQRWAHRLGRCGIADRGRLGERRQVVAPISVDRARASRRAGRRPCRKSTDLPTCNDPGARASNATSDLGPQAVARPLAAARLTDDAPPPGFLRASVVADAQGPGRAVELEAFEILAAALGHRDAGARDARDQLLAGGNELHALRGAKAVVERVALREQRLEGAELLSLVYERRPNVEDLGVGVEGLALH